MSDFLIKICGLSTPDTLDAVVSAGADMIGLVHFSRSPRHVELDRIGALADAARGRAKIVVLTVDPDDATLEALMGTARPDYLQLHGRESPARTAEIGQRFSVPTIKALGVSSPQDVAAAGAYASAADLLLFDAKPPKDATRPGGLGATFDWSLLSAATMPFLLSGGLAPTNVGDAVRMVRPAGVDVSSGVETAPGIKDPALVRRFVEEARAAARDARLDRAREE